MSEVCISNIVSAGNVYLQQPTHPYFRELEMLTQQMNACYADYSAPPLPEQIPGKFALYAVYLFKKPCTL